MADITIIPHDSTQTPWGLKSTFENNSKENMQRIRARNMGTGSLANLDNPVPWVKFGNLYLSCFETGEHSWGPIVRSLAGTLSNYTVLTGRHGDLTHFLEGGQFTGVADSDHLSQDLQRIGSLKKDFGGIDILPIDVSVSDFNSVLRLKSCIRQHIAAGRVVILAWCFSIYAMQGVSKNLEQSKLISLYEGLKTKSVKQIINEDWSGL